MGLALALALLLIATPVHATLIPHDDPVLGPGALIEDTVLGRTFLRVALTTPFSILSMLRALEPGGVFADFELATRLPTHVGTDPLTYINLFGPTRIGPGDVLHVTGLLGPARIDAFGDLRILGVDVEFTPPILFFDVQQLTFGLSPLRDQPLPGSGFWLVLEPAAIPLPGTLLLLGAGAALVVSRRCRASLGRVACRTSPRRASDSPAR